MRYTKIITKISLCCGILSSLIWQDTIERAVGHYTVSRDMTSRTRNVGSVSQTIFRALDKMAAGSGLGTRLCRHHLQNKMAALEVAVHLIKNRLRYYFAFYPTNESCSQRCARRIMLLRSLIKILLASYRSKCY